MNISDLKTILLNENIPHYLYCLPGDLSRDTNTIKPLSNGSWEVYYTERGVRDDVKVFESESEACGELLRRIKEDLPA